MDAVLAYEVFSATDTKSSMSSVALFSNIGAYVVPSETSTAVGSASAILLNVRNGYVYGTAAAQVDNRKRSTIVAQFDTVKTLSDQTKVATTIELSEKVELMMRELKKQL